MALGRSIPRTAYAPDSVWAYPLVTVFAPDKATADAIAGPGRLDGVAFFYAAMDSVEAQQRLGIFGRPDLAAKVERGD
jgi:hypothetical protein